jgi:two-component system cell cycle response regulator CpdR
MKFEIEDSHSQQLQESPDSNERHSTEGSRILVVDDDTTVNGMVSNVLQRSGYRVESAADGEEGWNAIRSHHFDLLITDYAMPRLDGLALLRKVRSNALPLPAILMSAAMPKDIGEIIDLVSPEGALHKPFRIQDLLYKVGALLDGGLDSVIGGLAVAGTPLPAINGRELAPQRKAARDDMFRLATRILDLEATPGVRSPGAPVIFGVCDKLRRPLRELTGGGGFRSILSHALALSRPEVTWLGPVKVSSEGYFEGLGRAEAPLGEVEVARGERVVVAQTLGLLFAFVGEYMTRVILEDVWHNVNVRA